MTEIPKMEQLVSYLYTQNWDALRPWINHKFEGISQQYLVNWLISERYSVQAITLIEYFGDQLELSTQLSKRKSNALSFVVSTKRVPENILLIKILLEICDPNQISENGFTPLLWAINSIETSILHTEICDESLIYEKLLLEYGANPNLGVKRHSLEFACELGNLPLVQLLLSYGADPTYSYFDPEVSKKEIVSCLSFLLKPSGEHNIPNPDVPLIFNELIHAGLPEHQQSFPLVIAAYHGRYVTIESLQILLERGCYDINQFDQDNQMSALMYASFYSTESSNFETVKFLVDHQADINLVAPENKLTALHYALSESEIETRPTDFETIKYLVEHGADLTLQNPEGYSPLAIYLSSKRKFSSETFHFLMKNSPEQVFQMQTKNGSTITLDFTNIGTLN